MTEDYGKARALGVNGVDSVNVDFVRVERSEPVILSDALVRRV
jgi:hypothetical protein